ncbi:hypothetical protein ASZ90_020103 [hydrocarbon metagenome]|uniref:Uncharacterized protein n=1 Tax=hydrocarbon metagenome TaxID=938273 RepID=A0A0W8E1C2_9ZZZZ
MDKKRAKEIMDSLGVIEVTHRNSPVWIENLDGDMANIEYLNRSGKARVPLADLYETEW